jgi:hypothetical protein
VLYPRATPCAANTKKILFLSSFWGIFDFFFVFLNNFGKRIKECYVTKEEGVSQTYEIEVHRQY